jgi:hypothetical protein
LIGSEILLTSNYGVLKIAKYNPTLTLPTREGIRLDIVPSLCGEG